MEKEGLEKLTLTERTEVKIKSSNLYKRAYVNASQTKPYLKRQTLGSCGEPFLPTP